MRYEDCEFCKTAGVPKGADCPVCDIRHVLEFVKENSNHTQAAVLTSASMFKLAMGQAFPDYLFAPQPEDSIH